MSGGGVWKVVWWCGGLWQVVRWSVMAGGGRGGRWRNDAN